jgi:hypothetical protein
LKKYIYFKQRFNLRVIPPYLKLVVGAVLRRCFLISLEEEYQEVDERLDCVVQAYVAVVPSK